MTTVNPDGPESKTDLDWLAESGLDQAWTLSSLPEHSSMANPRPSLLSLISQRLRSVSALPSLRDYKRRVIRWLDDVDNFYLSRVLYVLAMTLDGTTHSRQISVNGAIALSTDPMDRISFAQTSVWLLRCATWPRKLN
jgi:hypothetical protein